MDERARPLGVGAYVGVPVRLVDGTVYGSLCCVSDHPAPALRERDARLLDVLARIIADQIDRERHQRREARLEGEATAGQALLAALKARERYTAEHSEAVVELSTAVARELGLSEEEIVQVAQVALLHDVGKLGVPEAILQKPGALTDAEWRIVRAHPAIGERVVASIATLAHLAPAVRAEHERWDGGGYPDGLAGAAIPLASRICLACDAWHAMTSDRPYRPALREDDARAELRRHAGTQFCPRTVEALLTVLDGQRSAPAPEKAPDAAAQPESELRALIAVAGAVAAAHRLEDVLEVVAEETRRVVGASSVSISRWEREHDRVRTLINVGELGPDEERFPTGETYALADYPLAARLLREGESYVISRGDGGPRRARPPAARRARQGLLHRRAGDLRRAHVGQARVVRERRRGPVHAPARAVHGGDRRAGRRRDRPRRAVLARQRARLRRPAHRAREPARARRAAGGGGRARRGAGDRVLRPRRAQADQRHARATTPATARSGAPRTRSPPRRTGTRALGVPRRRGRVLRRARGRRRGGGRGARRRRQRRAGGAATSRSRSPAARPRCARARDPPTCSARPTPRSTPRSARGRAAW